MNTKEKLAVLEDIECGFQSIPFMVQGWDWNGQFYIRVGTLRPDVDDPSKTEAGYCTPRQIDYDISRDGLVKTVLGLCLDYVEHEIREGFYDKGIRLFGPHIPLEYLEEAAVKFHDDEYNKNNTI